MSHSSYPGISDGTPASDKPPSALRTPEQGALPHGACQSATVKHPPQPDLLSSPPIREFSSIPPNPILDEDFFPVTRPSMTISHVYKVLLSSVPLFCDHFRHLPHFPPWIATLLRWLCCLSLPVGGPGEFTFMARDIAQLAESLPSMQEVTGSVPSIAQTRHGRTCSKLELQSYPTLLSSRSAWDV